jgi:hypothetical protein
MILLMLDSRCGKVYAERSVIENPEKGSGGPTMITMRIAGLLPSGYLPNPNSPKSSGDCFR